MAPRFDIISKPNNWYKKVSTAAQKIDTENLSDTKIKQLAFWERLTSKLEREETPLTTRKPRPQHWHTFASGVSGIGVHAVFNARDNRLVAELYIVDDQKIFEILEKEKDKRFGEKFLWEPLPHKLLQELKL